jgi:hypothetical protein
LHKKVRSCVYLRVGSNDSRHPTIMDNYQTDVERLKNLMTSAATDLTIEAEHEAEYKQLRQVLLRQDKFKSVAPKFVTTCGTLKEFNASSFSTICTQTNTHKK